MNETKRNRAQLQSIDRRRKSRNVSLRNVTNDVTNRMFSADDIWRVERKASIGMQIPDKADRFAAKASN